MSVPNIGKPQVAFLFVVLLVMSIFLSWIKQQNLAVVIINKKFRHVVNKFSSTEMPLKEKTIWVYLGDLNCKQGWKIRS